MKNRLNPAVKPRDDKKPHSRDDKKPHSRDDKKPHSRDDKKSHLRENTAQQPHVNKQYKFIVYQICIVAALGGLLFGLDQGFIANAFTTIQSHYSLTLQQIENYAAILPFGGIFGALLSGVFARFLGRKKSLILAGFLFTLTTALSATLPPIKIMLICRFLIGFAVGVSAFVVPLYLSETAPKRIRGSMGTLFQLMITIGIFLISVTNVTIVKFVPLTAVRIPLMFLFVCLFALVMLVGSFTLPESPRWLMLKGRTNKARAVLQKIRHDKNQIEDELSIIRNNLSKSFHSLRFLGQKYFWKILLVCVLIQCFQQLVGINMMIYYAPTIFGYVSITGVFAMMLVPTANMIFTLPAIRLVEKIGRKKLLYIGSISMCLSMCVAGIILFTLGSQIPSQLDRLFLFGAVVIYIFGFAISWGPLAWLLCSELFPQESREVGMTVSTMVNLTFAGIVINTSLTAMNLFGNYVPFFIFAVFCLMSILFVYQFVPETKNVMLEKLESDLKTGVKLKNVGQHG